MFKKYEKMAMKIIDNSKHQEPESPKDLERLANAMVVLAGAEMFEKFIGEKSENFDGRREEFRRGVRGTGRFGMGGGSRRRFDGQSGGGQGGGQGGQGANWDGEMYDSKGQRMGNYYDGGGQGGGNWDGERGGQY